MNGRNLRFLICNNCNLRCDYCHNEYQGGINCQISDRVFSKESIITTLKENNLYNIDNIKISGGEPFLKPKEVNEIIDFSSNIKKNIVILTNATVHNSNLFNKIIENNVSEIRINLPTFDIERYKSITKASDENVKVLYENIEYLNNNNIPISLNVVLMCPSNEIKNFIIDYVKTATTAYKYKKFKSIRFIINDWLPELDKNNYLNEAHKVLASLTKTPGVERRGCIIDFNDYSIPISLVNCKRNDESDVYFVPPGTVLRDFVKGKAYD
jgi:molybdenum cofactor biosynthesis enzyme MoaA